MILWFVVGLNCYLHAEINQHHFCTPAMALPISSRAANAKEVFNLAPTQKERKMTSKLGWYQSKRCSDAEWELKMIYNAFDDLCTSAHFCMIMSFASLTSVIWYTPWEHLTKWCFVNDYCIEINYFNVTFISMIYFPSILKLGAIKLQLFDFFTLELIAKQTWASSVNEVMAIGSRPDGSSDQQWLVFIWSSRPCSNQPARHGWSRWRPTKNCQPPSDEAGWAWSGPSPCTQKSSSLNIYT